MSVLRDTDVFLRIKEALIETGRFSDESILLNQIWDWGAVPSGADTFAMLWPRLWRELDTSNWEGESHERTVSFWLAVGVREQDHGRRLDKLQALESVVQNVITGNSFGGCIQAKTRIESGTYEQRPSHPSQACIMQGEFAYFVDPANRSQQQRYQ